MFASSNGTTDTYRSLPAAPDPKMRLTKLVLAEYALPFDPSDNQSYDYVDDLNAKLHFECDCPTNLAMLDVWYKISQENFLFVPPSFCFSRSPTARQIL
jgi:hypothetical protein